mgnify:CR=1 FL=1
MTMERVLLDRWRRSCGQRTMIDHSETMQLGLGRWDWGSSLAGLRKEQVSHQIIHPKICNKFNLSQETETHANDVQSDPEGMTAYTHVHIFIITSHKLGHHYDDEKANSNRRNHTEADSEEGVYCTSTLKRTRMETGEGVQPLRNTSSRVRIKFSVSHRLDSSSWLDCASRQQIGNGGKAGQSKG